MAAGKTTVRMRGVDELVPYLRNSRTHSEEQIGQLVASMREFGFTNPILVDGDKGILAGHARVTAARRLGLDKVPTIDLAHLSEAQRRAYIIADNKLAENAGWDLEALRFELGALKAEGFDLSLTGFGELELGQLFSPGNAGRTDPDDAPPLAEKAVTAPGECWILGRHRLVCGDSTSADAVELALCRERPHLMVTDPPYGVDYDPDWRNRADRASGKAYGARAVGQVLNDGRADWRAAWALFPGSVAYVWHGGLHAGVVAESLAACRLDLRSQIVWVKTRPVIGRGAYHWQHEPLYVAERQPSTAEEPAPEPDHELAAYAVRKSNRADWRGGRKQSTVWFIEHIKSDTGHGTQKPVECMRRPIENNSLPGDHVYEPFSGSGTTIIACEMTGRCCDALELSPAYVDVAVKRWQAFTGQPAFLEHTGEAFDLVAAGRLKAAA